MSEQCEHAWRDSKAECFSFELCGKCFTTKMEWLEQQLAIERQRAEVLAAQLAAAVEIVRQVEWGDSCNVFDYCPVCTSAKDAGHDSDCRLGQFLASPPAAAMALLERVQQAREAISAALVPAGDTPEQVRVQLKAAYDALEGLKP